VLGRHFYRELWLIKNGACVGWKPIEATRYCPCNLRDVELSSNPIASDSNASVLVYSNGFSAKETCELDVSPSCKLRFRIDPACLKFHRGPPNEPNGVTAQNVCWSRVFPAKLLFHRLLVAVETPCGRKQTQRQMKSTLIFEVCPGVVALSHDTNGLSRGAGVKAALAHKSNFLRLPHPSRGSSALPSRADMLIARIDIR